MTTTPRRGRLRVYLGAAPGVGKTYAMLDEGRRRRERGTDVVVGFVETHGRPHTAEAVGDLEVVPRVVLDHAGTQLEEMDLDAVLVRRPEVVLVDELAHTNVPGLRHEKRWQDVEELLEAGIEVVTTVNIQHLESLNDVTKAVTGVRQRETVPDEVVRAADQVELVDMSPQSLRRRMAHGNVYPPERVDAALSHYFREGNLTALRELALLWLADRVEEGLERYREQHAITDTWATRDRIVVAVTGGPESLTLLRRAARITSRRSRGSWMALHVTRHDGLSGAGPEQLTATRTRTEELGGTFHVVVGDDPVEAILDFARAENADQLLLGASRRGRLSTFLRPGVGERLVAASGDVDVHIVTHDYARGRGARARPHPVLGRTRLVAGFVVAVALPMLLVALMLSLPAADGLPAESLVLMAAVVATALVGGLAPSVLTALWSGLLLNFFFSPPLHRLTIAEASDAVAVVLFVLVGIAVASVVDRSARRTEQARRARAEADALTALSHSLLNAGDDMEGLLGSACELFGASGASVLRVRPAGTGGSAYDVVAGVGEVPGSPSEGSVSTRIDDQSLLVLRGGKHGASQRSLVNAYAAYAHVIEGRRRASAAEVERFRLAEADRTRTALLAAVSHDLRSPLAAVKASVATLRDETLDLTAEDEAVLLENVESSADRLHALVANLLDMSRIHTGAVSVTLDEVGLGGAVRRALAPLPGSERIAVDVPADLVALADPGLLDRVIANLAENALRYTPDEAPIRLDGTTTTDDDGSDRVVLRLSDSGPGVPAGDHERLFAPFQRLGDVPDQDGVGLGLAVARGLTEAMGGRLLSEDTPAGGLTFVLDLPRPDEEAVAP